MLLTADLSLADWPVLWLVRALSLFNTMALLWLGLTVLLNVEHRRAGNLLAGGGLLLGGLFFALHSAIVGLQPTDARDDVQAWWPLAWWALIGLPYLWYLMVAWYTNLVRSWRTLACTLSFAALALLLVNAPPLSYAALSEPRALGALAQLGLPLALGYSLCSLLCFALALTALRNPVISDRFLGDEARRRARPWLIAATLVLLLVSVTVGMLTIWFLNGLAVGGVSLRSAGTWTQLMVADSMVSAEVALTTLLVGRAMASYEVFTGRTLPRQGLLRHWRRTVTVSAGYAALQATALALPLPASYALVLAASVMAAFLALLSWRLFLERERGIAQLRTFAGSDWSTGGVSESRTTTLSALAIEVLGARAAVLQPLGPMQAIVTLGLSYPPGQPAQPIETTGLTQDVTCVRLPNGTADSRWLVPLWDARGLTGALLLGDKLDGGLYTQEEMEVARATGERLLGDLASAELTRRLLVLERERLAETQLMDQRTRRVLHDDVLPLLQTAMLRLDAADRTGGAPASETTALLGDAHRMIAGLLRELPSPFSAEVAKLGVVAALQRAVTNELADAFSAITWSVEPALERSRALSPRSAEVAFTAAREAARNAARHGPGGDAGRPLRLTVQADWRDGLAIALCDDGVGTPAPHPPTNNPDAGHGLALHGTMVAVIGGTLTTERSPGGGTTVRIFVPMAD